MAEKRKKGKRKGRKQSVNEGKIEGKMKKCVLSEKRKKIRRIDETKDDDSSNG